MTFELANAGWMYLLGAFVCLFVMLTAVAFLLRARKQAKEMSLDPSVFRKTVVTSLIFSLLPSVSILIGVIALSGTLGIPLPWIRLSVIGALHYEQTAVGAAYPDITMAAMTKEQFVTIASVMTLGILSGPLFCLFGFKWYDKKILAKAKKEQEKNLAKEADSAEGEALAPEESDLSEPAREHQEPEQKKKRSFGPVLFNAAFIALICAFLAEEIAKLKNVGAMDEINPKTGVAYGNIGSFTPTVVVVVSFGVMALVRWMSRRLRWKWLDDFAIGISMLCGMASAVLIERLV